MARAVTAKPIKGLYPVPLIRCNGQPLTGKTKLAIAFARWLAEGDKNKCYVWSTDGREHEYAAALGEGNVMATVANPLDIPAVHDEIGKDLRAGVFGSVCFFSLDTATHIYRQASGSNLLKTLGGQGSSGHSVKAVTMQNVGTIVMEVNRPAMVITHIYEKSDHKNLAKIEERDTLSPTEDARWDLLFNIKLETFKDARGFGVIVRKCREREGMQPFILRDEPNGFFRNMPKRIMDALYVADIPKDEPKGWAEFGLTKPFPDKGPKFKTNAVNQMVQFFISVEGMRFYAFGDPKATPIKQNGDKGINGAVNHAINAYGVVATAYQADGGSNLGELTVKLKEYTEAKAQAIVEAYLDEMVQANEATLAANAPEPKAEQDSLPMLEGTEPSGDKGAAYKL